MKKEEELKDHIPDKQSIYTLIIVVCKYTYHIHRTICVLFSSNGCEFISKSLSTQPTKNLTRPFWTWFTGRLLSLGCWKLQIISSSRCISLFSELQNNRFLVNLYSFKGFERWNNVIRLNLTQEEGTGVLPISPNSNNIFNTKFSLTKKFTYLFALTS